MEGGYFGIYMASSNDKVELAIEAIKTILKDYQEKGISSKELRVAKDMTSGQFEMSLQTNEDFIGLHGVPFLHGKSIDQYYKQNEKNLLGIWERR